MARHFHGTGIILRFIEYMDVGSTNGWRMDDVVPAAEIVERIDAELAAGAGRARTTAARWPAAGATGRRRRDRRHRLGHAAVLRRLHPRPALVRGRCSTPACSAARGHDSARLLRGGAVRRGDRRLRRRVWRRRADRYSELRTAGRPPAPKVEMSHIGG